RLRTMKEECYADVSYVAGDDDENDRHPPSSGQFPEPWHPKLHVLVKPRSRRDYALTIWREAAVPGAPERRVSFTSASEERRCTHRRKSNRVAPVTLPNKWQRAHRPQGRVGMALGNVVVLRRIANSVRRPLPHFPRRDKVRGACERELQPALRHRRRTRPRKVRSTTPPRARRKSMPRASPIATCRRFTARAQLATSSPRLASAHILARALPTMMPRTLMRLRARSRRA